MSDLPADGSRWIDRDAHRHFLFDQVLSLLRFHRATLSADGHFGELDDDGALIDSGGPQKLLVVARMVHSYALGELVGLPGCEPVVERGLEALWREHRDERLGGYWEQAGAQQSGAAHKTAYGHAHVLLAASSAWRAGHDARALCEDVAEVLDERFWSEEDGASRDAFSAEWSELEPYRGANANMHLCEAYLAAYDATGDQVFATRAERIGALVIERHARARGWMLPEHYDEDWGPILDYNRDHLDHPFRPYGVTVGHLLEWSRLLRGIAAATGEVGWTAEAARGLFATAVEVGWDTALGGLAYTVDFDGRQANPHRYWWPIAEGIAASAVHAETEPNVAYEAWYRRFWDFAAAHLIDHARGGWYAQLDEQNRRIAGPWYGKPDLYHALQACLVPLVPRGASVAGALAEHPPTLCDAPASARRNGHTGP